MHRSRKQMILYAAVLCCICAGAVSAGLFKSILKEKGQKALDLGADAERMTVQIASNGMFGRGVIYKSRKTGLLIVTAAHILEQGQGEASVTITFYDGQTAKGAESRLYTDADLAFIRVPREALTEKQLKEYTAATVDKESFDSLKPGDGLFVGDPGNVSEKILEGVLSEPWIYLEDFSQYMMTARIQAEPGMSGAGVLDEEGHFVGILCGVSKEGEAAVLPFSIIEAKYTELTESLL